jgi:Icc-related predicted phosphoesterase
MMRILFVADLHYALKQFDWLLEQAGGYDVVAIGGDLLDLGSDLDYEVQILVVEKYLQQLRARTRVLVCSGNHDGDTCNEADEGVAGWLIKARRFDLAVDFDHVQLGDTLVTVCPWWNGPVGRLNLESLLEEGAALPKQRWIWLHHAPPGDSRVSWAGHKDVGDEYLTRWIWRHQPDLVLSGHVHRAPFLPDGSWIDRLGKTWVMNPGFQRGPQPASIEIDLKSMRAEWNSQMARSERLLGAG